jgi:hypothetical protein
MNLFLQKVRLEFLVGLIFITLVLACKGPKPSTNSESWNGTFSTKKDGVQKISVYFSFKGDDNNNITGFRVGDDRITKIDFKKQ